MSGVELLARYPLAWLAGGCLAAGAVLADAAPLTHDEVNAELGLAYSELVHLSVDDTVGAPLLVQVPIEGATYTLDLLPHSNRAPNYQLYVVGDDRELTPVAPGAVRTFRGTVLEIPGSRVAASVDGQGLTAAIQLDGDARYFVEPLAGRIADADPGEHVLYMGSDALRGGEVCGFDADLHAADRLIDFVDGHLGDTGGGPEMPPGTLCTAELACDADFQYYQDRGSSVSNVESRINSVINAVNLQYEDEVGITHAITAIVVRTSSGANPYSTSDSSALLSQFRNEWENNQAGIPRDVAELFTGRNLNGSVIGIAWLSAVCGSLGYNVVESDFNNVFSCATDLSAHELGHNWGADHCSCPGNTMNPGITCANEFSPTATIPDILSFRDSRSCLDCAPLVDGDPALITGASSNLGSTIVVGDFTDLAASDDDRLVTESAYQASQNRHRSNTFIDLQSPHAAPSAIVFDIETGVTKTNVTTKIFLRNYAQGNWTRLETFGQSKDDVINTYAVSANAADYVNANGRIRVRVNMLRSGDTKFRCRIDSLEMLVSP